MKHLLSALLYIAGYRPAELAAYPFAATHRRMWLGALAVASALVGAILLGIAVSRIEPNHPWRLAFGALAGVVYFSLLLGFDALFIAGVGQSNRRVIAGRVVLSAARDELAERWGRRARRARAAGGGRAVAAVGLGAGAARRDGPDVRRARPSPAAGRPRGGRGPGHPRGHPVLHGAIMLTLIRKDIRVIAAFGWPSGWFAFLLTITLAKTR